MIDAGVLGFIFLNDEILVRNDRPCWHTIPDPCLHFTPEGLSWSKNFRFSVVDNHWPSNLDPTWSLQVPLRVCNSDTLHSLQVFQLFLAWWKGCMRLICPWKPGIKCNICKVSGYFRLDCLDICIHLLVWKFDAVVMESQSFWKDTDLPGCHLYSGSAASSNAPLRAQLHVLVLTSIHLMIDSVCLAVCGMLSMVFTSCSRLTAVWCGLGFCHFLRPSMFITFFAAGGVYPAA